MSLRILDWFGLDLTCQSGTAKKHRREGTCPFLSGRCTKTFNDRTTSGVCTVAMASDDTPVIICPNRLYASDYAVLHDVVEIVFGEGHTLIRPDDHSKVEHDGTYVVAFGKNFGKELRLPSRQSGGGYFVDWVLARIDADGDLNEFVAVEVQSIDTTGTYRPEVEVLRKGRTDVANSKAGLNWENVNKRILPQLIYKGHVLRREALCKKGLFFVTPEAVYRRIDARLGGTLVPYDNLQPGSISFLWYQLAAPRPDGIRPLSLAGQFSTTVDQVVVAFGSPVNLPPAGVYEAAIREVLNEL